MKKKRIIALINSPINSQKDLDKKDFDKILNKIVEKLLKGFRSNPALLHEKYDVKTAEGIESSTLIHFLSVKNPAILVELLEKGDDLRKLLIGVDDKKRTFLHYLADAPLTQEEIPKLRIIIKTLLENQTLDINAVAEDGNTALHKSIQAKNLYLTELLLDLRGLDIEKTNKDGHKAIDLCENKPELYRIFIRYMNKLERDDNITYVRNTPILQAFDSDYKYPSLLVTPRTNLSNDREYKKLSKHNKQKSTTALPRSHNSSGSKRNRSQSGITSDDTVQTSSTSGSSELSSNSNQFSEELSERDSKFQPLSPISFSFKYKEWGEAFKQSTSSVTNEILQDFSKLSKEYILPDPSQLISKLNTPTSEHLTYLFITNYLNSVIQGKKADVFRKLDRIPNYFIYATLNQPDDVILGNSNPIIATPNFDAIDLSHLNPEDYEKRKNLINYLWTLTSCHYKENGKNQRRFNKKKIADTTLGLLTEFSILDICRATRNIYKQLDNDQKICANLIIMFSIIFSYREVNELSAEIQAQIDIIIGLNNKSDSLESPRKSTETISIKYQIKEIMENIISKCLMIDQDVADVGNSEKKFTRDALPVDHEIQNFKNMCALYDQLSSPETLVDFNQLVTKAMTTEDTHAQFELTGLVAREIKKLTITMFQELRFIDLTEENSVVLTNYTNTTEKIGNYLKNKILSDQNPYKGLNFLLELSKHILSSDSKEFSDLNFLYEINAILISPEIYNLPEFDKLDKQTLKEIEEITSPLRNNINHNQFYKKHERTLPQISFTKRAIIAAIEGNSDRMERYEAIGKSVVQFMETKCITQGKFIHQTNIISSLESYQILSNEQLREKMLEHCAASSIALTEELKFDVLLELIDKNYLSQGIVPGAIKNSEYTSPKKLAHKLVEILSERVDKFSIDEKELYYKQLEKIIDKIFTTKLSNLTKNEMTDVRNKMKQLKNKIKGTKEPGFQKLSTHQSRHTLASPLMFTRDKENKDESRTIVINLNSYSENILGLLEQIHTLCQQKESNTEFFYKNEKLESISKLPSCLIAMIQENLRQKPLTEENRKILLSQVEKLQEIIPGVLGLCQKQHAYSNEENEQIIKDIIQLKDEISKSNETVQGTPNLGLSIAGARAMLFQHNRHLSEPTATTASNTNQSPSHSND